MDSFDLFLFSTSPNFIRPAVAGGISGIMVDWEYIGKETRQSGADTQINHDTPEDLLRVRKSTHARVICRINAYGPHTEKEVETALETGADELLLPMVRTVEEVTSLLQLVRERCHVGILMETPEAVLLAEELGNLPLSRIYAGLNDLAIARGDRNIFTSVADGTIDKARRLIRVPFGFGGLTAPELGNPIPCRLLIAEMARLNCSFSFLRRSFHRDVRGRNMAAMISSIQSALAKAQMRTAQQVALDTTEFQQRTQQLSLELKEA